MTTCEKEIAQEIRQLVAKLVDTRGGMERLREDCDQLKPVLEEGSLPAAWMGWYSEQMAEVSGTYIWRHKDGTHREVTWVTGSHREPHTKYADMRSVGLLAEFVSLGRPAGVPRRAGMEGEENNDGDETHDAGDS